MRKLMLFVLGMLLMMPLISGYTLFRPSQILMDWSNYNLTLNNLTSTYLCLTGDDCITTWPVGGAGSGSWPIIEYYLYNNSGNLDINETLLNNTIIAITDARDDVGAGGSQWPIYGPYLFNNSGTLDYNESYLNDTIIWITDDRDSTGTDDQTCAEVPGCVENAITNSTMNQSTYCGNIDGATSNLCTLEDTDTTNTTRADLMWANISDYLLDTNTWNTTQQMIDAVNGTPLNGTAFTNINCNNIDGTMSDLCTIVDTFGGNTTEQMQDAVMSAIDDGTQTHITVTYEDGTNDMDFVVSDDWWDSCEDAYVCEWWNEDADIPVDEIKESKINFTTVCAAGQFLQTTGNDLQCIAPPGATDDQILSFSNGNISIEDGNSVNITDIHITGTLDGYNAADLLDNTDEQTLSYSNGNITISGGNSINISDVNTDTNTWNTTAEMQNAVNNTPLNLSHSYGYNWSDIENIPAGFADGTDDTGEGGKTADGYYLYNDTTTIYFNETRLNITIKTLDTNCSVDGSCDDITYDSELDYTVDTNCSVTDSCDDIVYSAELATGLATQDQCSEITGCVENAVTNATMNQSTYCGNIDGATSNLCTLEDTNTYNTTQQMIDAVNGTRLNLTASTDINCSEIIFDTGKGNSAICDGLDATEAGGDPKGTNDKWLYNDTQYIYQNETYVWTVIYNETEVDTLLAAQDACSEITGCVENAVTNSTMNQSVYCSNIDGATSNLCTLEDTDTTNTTRADLMWANISDYLEDTNTWNTTAEMQNAVNNTALNGTAFTSIPCSSLVFDTGVGSASICDGVDATGSGGTNYWSLVSPFVQLNGSVTSGIFQINLSNLFINGTSLNSIIEAYNTSWDYTVDTNETTRVDELWTNSTHWETAYNWGDHSTQGYLTSVPSVNLTTNFVGDVTGPYGATVVGDDTHNHVLANIDEISGGIGSEDMEAAEDFGDFTCDGNDAGCTLDTDYLPLTGGTVAGNTSFTGYNVTVDCLFFDSGGKICSGS